MKKPNLLFILLIIAISATFAVAQPGRPFTEAANQGDTPRLRIFRELGLSKQQRQQIQKINRKARPARQQANLAFRQARNQLDQAIYSDEVNENEVNARLQAVAEAQAKVTRIKTMHELRVRRVLTPAQLTRFREFRRKFAKRRRAGAVRRNRNLNRRPAGNNRPRKQQRQRPF